jgi:hypothetical protein
VNFFDAVGPRVQTASIFGQLKWLNIIEKIQPNFLLKGGIG